jgi:hypothetical protein
MDVGVSSGEVIPSVLVLIGDNEPMLIGVRPARHAWVYLLLHLKDIFMEFTYLGCNGLWVG